MTLTDRAVLEIDEEYYFHLPGAEWTNEMNVEHIVGQRGQLLKQVADIGPLNGGGEGRSGINLDLGVGSDQLTITFRSGYEKEYDPPLQWGDGSGGTGQDNATEDDATGSDVHPITKEDVIQNRIRVSRADSQKPARLHKGEWTDGSWTDGDADAGIFGEPIKCTVVSFVTKKDVNRPSDFEGTLTVIRSDALPGLDDVELSVP